MDIWEVSARWGRWRFLVFSSNYPWEYIYLLPGIIPCKLLLCLLIKLGKRSQCTASVCANFLLVSNPMLSEMKFEPKQSVLWCHCTGKTAMECSRKGLVALCWNRRVVQYLPESFCARGVLNWPRFARHSSCNCNPYITVL